MSTNRRFLQFQEAQNLVQQTRLEEAEAIFIKLWQEGNKTEALIGLNLAHCYREKSKLEEAEKLFKETIALNSKHHTVGAKSGLALTYFQQERFDLAWKAFEIRYALMRQPPRITKKRNGESVNIPQWKGETQNINHLLIMAEQGLGDTLQFARYIPLLEERKIKTSFVAPKRMHRILKTLSGGIELLPLEEAGQVNTSHWASLLELPALLNISPKDYATPSEFLRAEPHKLQHWQSKLPNNKLNICIAWQGNPDPSIDLGRSAKLDIFKPLLDIPNINLISLQQGYGEDQLMGSSFRNRIQILDGVDNEASFIDSAAILKASDGLVSIDSSLAHCAGALNVETHLMLKRLGTDWRWLNRQDNSIWYENHQLYRQEKHTDWSKPISKIAARLALKQNEKFRISEIVAPSLMPETEHLNNNLWNYLEEINTLKQQEKVVETMGDLKIIILKRCALEDKLSALQFDVAIDKQKQDIEFLLDKKKFLSSQLKSTTTVKRTKILEDYWRVCDALEVARQNLLK